MGLLSKLLRKNSPSGISAIGVDGDGITLVCLERGQRLRPKLLACDFRAFAGGGKPADLMRELAQRHHLQKTACTTVLEGGDYKFMVTEAPEVPAAELSAALRWRIKDLIDGPVNEITLDVFEAPRVGANSNKRAVYVVAARNEVLKRRVDLLVHAGAKLDVIDIAELAQRNIAALLPQDAQGVALLSLRQEHGLITLTRQGELYLSRTLSVGQAQLAHEATRDNALGQIVLEVQRSLDYYESHFRQAPLRHLLLAPLAVDAAPVIDYLRANLGVDVSLLDLNEHIDHPGALPEDWQSRFFLPLGAALREAGAAA